MPAPARLVLAGTGASRAGTGWGGAATPLSRRRGAGVWEVFHTG